jgi:hypothetical protein
VKKGTLIYHDNLRGDFKAKPIGTAEFKLQGVPLDVELIFDNDAVTIVAIGAPERFQAYEPVSYSPEELQGFVGTFLSPELNVMFECKAENETLMLHLEDGTTAAFHAVSDNVFLNDEYGVFRFERDGTNTVTGFKLEFERVKNLQFIKQ